MFCACYLDPTADIHPKGLHEADGIANVGGFESTGEQNRIFLGKQSSGVPIC